MEFLYKRFSLQKVLVLKINISIIMGQLYSLLTNQNTVIEYTTNPSNYGFEQIIKDLDLMEFQIQMIQISLPFWLSKVGL